MNAARLYTADVLALATSLANYPPLETAGARRGHARSATCGSAIELTVAVDQSGAIRALGVRAQACAVGQAAAAIFAGGAAGRTAAMLEQDLAQLQAWLGADGPLPDWPGLAVLAAARDYPARHGALQLAWKAALSALATSQPAR